MARKKVECGLRGGTSLYQLPASAWRKVKNVPEQAVVRIPTVFYDVFSAYLHV
jgi:hypothetical protein